MIRLTRVDRYSIHLQFDYDGARSLLEAFRHALENEKLPVGVEVELSVFTRKWSSRVEKALFYISESDQPSHMERYANEIYLFLEREELEDATDRFRACIKDRYFFPAELCEVYTGKMKARDYVYCELIG